MKKTLKIIIAIGLYIYLFLLKYKSIEGMVLLVFLTLGLLVQFIYSRTPKK